MNNEYANFGTKVIFEETKTGHALRWSGRSVWCRDQDYDRSLNKFMSDVLKEVSPNEKFSLHIENLTFMSSSTTKFLAAIMGDVLKRGCNLKVHYVPERRADHFLCDGVKEAVKSEEASKLDFVPVPGGTESEESISG